MEQKQNEIFNNIENDNVDNNDIEFCDTIENIDIDCDNPNLIEISSDSKSKMKKALIFTGCALSLGGALIALSNHNNISKDEIAIEFTIIDEDGNERNRTSKEMREFYSPEGEEFIKALYPDSQDSDFALLNIGKSIEKELSDIEFITANNKVVALNELKGKKIILDFALITCPSCQDELKHLSTKDSNADTVILHIFPRSSTEEIKNVFKENEIKYNSENIVSATGMNGLNFEDFNVTHVPSKLYINENGVITYVTTNSLTDDELYNLHYNRAFGETEKVLDYLKNE